MRTYEPGPMPALNPWSCSGSGKDPFSWGCSLGRAGRSPRGRVRPLRAHSDQLYQLQQIHPFLGLITLKFTTHKLTPFNNSLPMQECAIQWKRGKRGTQHTSLSVHAHLFDSVIHGTLLPLTRFPRIRFNSDQCRGVGSTVVVVSVLGDVVVP